MTSCAVLHEFTQLLQLDNQLSHMVPRYLFAVNANKYLLFKERTGGQHLPSPMLSSLQQLWSSQPQRYAD